MFVDTHCHLYNEYYSSIEEEITASKKLGIGTFIVAGCDRKSNAEVMELIQKYPEIYGTLGIHPEFVHDYREEDLKFLEENLKNSKIVAIGEIGLDYHYEKESKEEQKNLFTYQLEIAKRNHLPVVIHSREATEDTITILKQYPEVKGVIHSFSGSLEVANVYIKMGYKLGINGVVTFKNSHLKELLPSILSSIILETDSPYLTPHPHRGEKNSPQNISLIADFICEYLKISKEQLLKITNENVKSVFDI